MPQLVTTRSWPAAIAGVLVTLCAGCGGEGQGSGTATVAVVAVPSPAPSPTPAPTPSPTATATVPRFLGALPGTQLVGVMACARDQAIYDGQRRLTGLQSLTAAKIDNSLQLTYRGPDSYAFDVNGFGGPSFGPADTRPSSNRAYDQFVSSVQGEMFIEPLMTFTALGLETGAGLCFFAVGDRADGLPEVRDEEHFVAADGLAGEGGTLLRLYGSQGQMRVAIDAREVSFDLRLSGRGDPFGDFTARPQREITRLTSTLKYDGNGAIRPTTVQTGNGYTGTISGVFTTRRAYAVGGGGGGAVFTFELRNQKGELIFGAISTEANRI
jgi:hypothetical protein